jgi:CMP-N,N'-diacetyllegionaminic acid synthase
MTTIASICARGGSKGVPGKNIRLFAGKPLIVHSIEQALACPGIDRVVVSTDAEDIAEVARSAGAWVPFLRPTHLATDSAPKIPVIQHLADEVRKTGVEISRLVDLDATSPLRLLSDIERCLELYDGDTDLVITTFESEKNPYFNMVEAKEDGRIDLVKRPDQPVTGRQAAPKVYSMNASIYVWRPDALSKGLWGGRVKMYVMPRERSIDIDSELDFQLAERLMVTRNDN